MFGFIKDSSTQKAIGYASVRIKGIKEGIAADGDGRYELALPDMGGQVMLIVSAVGYETKEYITTVNNFKAAEILLAPAPDELTPVVVTAGNVMGKISRTVCTTTTAGKVITVQEISRIQQIKRQVNDWLPGKKDVRIFPNPVIAGNSINMQVKLKATGEYKLELMDAAGRVVYIQALQIVQKNS
ncbi:carboxypeptidase-like regulatory domain-containing protein [Paraflavitalea speifideaquila]|uniref:carboxypeptidase-like regulatory domain-containing protein n=1 Tax=Paraflavitalea speifideaquila TaxID=3076558 RepID=UPI0028E73F9F|nr:carboxypeptidase-like regulatory domain-containing protein [Paraflavitalea speifideiaquila]